MAYEKRLVRPFEAMDKRESAWRPPGPSTVAL